MRPTVVAFTFGSDPAALRRTLDRIGRAVSDAGAAALAGDCRIVLAEVFNNIAEHAYGGAPGPITLRLTCGPGRLSCVVTDRGAPMPGFPRLGRRFPDVDAEKPMGLPEGGFGWALVRQLARDIRYDRVGDRNLLRFDIR